MMDMQLAQTGDMFASTGVVLSSGIPVRPTAGSSIVGLDRFVYLRGGSGQRYVFSKVDSAQAALYSDCVFAWRDAGSSTARPCAQPPLTAKAGQLYVHLLDGKDAQMILNDLRNAYNRQEISCI